MEIRIKRDDRMNKAFELILERLEEIRNSKITINSGRRNGKTLVIGYSKGMQDTLDEAVSIVKEVAEEYNNGWILCSERLPEDWQDVLICFEHIDGCIIAWYSQSKHTWHVSATDNICKKNPVAWKPLPEPYKKEGVDNGKINAEIH